MTSTSKGLLAVWTDLDPAGKDDFFEWYNREHIAERVAVPGFLNARRYEALSGTPAYFAAYDTESPAVLSSAIYKERLAHQTEWSKRVFSFFRNTVRLVGALLAESGRGQGGALLSLRLEAPLGREEALRQALRGELAQRIYTQHRIVRVCIGEGNVAPLGDFPTGQGVAGPENRLSFVLLVESSEAQALETLRHGLLGDEALAGMGAEPPSQAGIYRLGYFLGS
jgi:hypothetical protein